MVMKIMIINPNSDEEMTKLIEKSGKEFIGKRGNIICKGVEDAPRFIDSYQDKIIAAPGMIKLVKEYENEVDAFIIACHCDPNIEVIKELTNKVVVGIGESSMKIASMIGHKFSVISSDRHSTPNKEALIESYGLSKYLASIKTPKGDENLGKLDSRDLLASLGEKAVSEDMAEVLVLGCAGYSKLDKYIERKVGVPVLDGVICAIMVAEGMINYGISTSKIRRYNGNY